MTKAEAALAAAAAAAPGVADPLETALSPYASLAAAAGSTNPPPSPLDVMTLKQAAEYLQITQDVLRKEADAGRIFGQRLGGEWRFLRAVIIEWLRTPSLPRRPPSGVGADYLDENPDEMIASIYRERRKNPVGG